MAKASRVMYSIANFFTWIILLLAVAGIVLSALVMANVLTNEQLGGLNFGLPALIICIVIFLVSWITIAMVRKAKQKGSSKGWDVWFLLCGIFGGNIFYFLGAIFGLIAKE